MREFFPGKRHSGTLPQLKMSFVSDCLNNLASLLSPWLKVKSYMYIRTRVAVLFREKKTPHSHIHTRHFCCLETKNFLAPDVGKVPVMCQLELYVQSTGLDENSKKIKEET